MTNAKLDITRLKLAKYQIPAECQITTYKPFNRYGGTKKLHEHKAQSIDLPQSLEHAYKDVPSKVKSIRKNDDNLMKKSKNFEALYRQAF